MILSAVQARWRRRDSSFDRRCAVVAVIRPSHLIKSLDAADLDFEDLESLVQSAEGSN